MDVVFGASGTLGREVVARLADAGRQVRAVSRNPGALAVPNGVQTVAADVRQPESIRGALQGAETVVAAIHGLVPPTRDNNPSIVDGIGLQRVIDAAVTAGVSRFVLMSAPGPAPDAPDRFSRIKHATEEHVRASGLPYTIVRAPSFMEVHGLVLLGEPLVSKGKVQIIGAGDTPIGWVSVTDVAAVVVDAVVGESGENLTVQVGSFVSMSRLEALAILEQASGRTASRSHLPPAVARLIGRIGGIINPGLGYLMEVAAGKEADPGTVRPPDRMITPTRSFDDVAAAWAAGLA